MGLRPTGDRSRIDSKRPDCVLPHEVCRGNGCDLCRLHCFDTFGGIDVEPKVGNVHADPFSPTFVTLVEVGVGFSRPVGPRHVTHGFQNLSWPDRLSTKSGHDRLTGRPCNNLSFPSSSLSLRTTCCFHPSPTQPRKHDGSHAHERNRARTHIHTQAHTDMHCFETVRSAWRG